MKSLIRFTSLMLLLSISISPVLFAQERTADRDQSTSVTLYHDMAEITRQLQATKPGVFRVPLPPNVSTGEPIPPDRTAQTGPGFS